MVLRVQVSRKEGGRSVSGDPRSGGGNREPSTCHPLGERRHLVIRDVYDLPDYLRADIGLPPRVTADPNGCLPISPIIR